MLSLFISYEGDFRNVVTLIEKLTEKSIIITRDEIGKKCNFQLLDIEFHLMDNHELEDDFGIAFSKYKIQINMIQLTSGQVVNGYIKMVNSMSLYLADKLSQSLNTEVIVVEDLQELVHIVINKS